MTELRSWIETAPPGARLPSSRTLAARHGAGPVTVQKAMNVLVGLGLVESRPGAGSFVLGRATARSTDFGWQTGALSTASAMPPPLPSPARATGSDAIGLHSGYPAPELLPERAVRAAIARAARGESAMTSSPAEGLPALRSWFATELASATPQGISPVAPHDVVVVPGTQSALGSVLRALTAPGQAVVMESPTYWGAILAARRAGLRIVPVASDAEGPDPEEIAQALERSGARVLYAQPTFANPTGALWSPARREAVLSAAREAGAFLVEDDWAHDLGIDAHPAPLAAYDDAGHVVYVRSLTKSVSPALRVGAVIARGPARDRLLADRATESMYVSGLLQTAALEVVMDSAWRGHLRRLREGLRERRDLLARAVAEQLPQASIEHLPRGGLNLWVRLPEHADAEAVVRGAEQHGVLAAAGTAWFPADVAGPYLRLNYAGPNPSRFTEGVGIIGRVLEGSVR